MVPNMESNVTLLNGMDAKFEKIWKDTSDLAANIVGEDAEHLKLVFKNVFYRGVMYEVEHELNRQRSLREKSNV